MYTFHSYLDDNDNFKIFDININNKNELVYLFDENFGNIDQIIDNEKIFDNCQSSESTENISYQSYSSICNDLYNVMKSNNKITKFVVGVLLEMMEEIISKYHIQLDLDQMITSFSNLDNTFTPLEKENRFLDRTSRDFYTRIIEKEKQES